MGQDLAGPPQRAADDLAEIDAGAVFGTMAPDSSLVMSSRLAMKRLSRSDSSMTVAEQFGLRRLARASCEISQR